MSGEMAIGERKTELIRTGKAIGPLREVIEHIRQVIGDKTIVATIGEMVVGTDKNFNTIFSPILLCILSVQIADSV